MASARRNLLKPRKRPVQARSEATVEALFEASIQVLLSTGYRKLTTTRVAERAGVSVGTLYQYFPNREALILSLIERYLEDLVGSIEQGCGALNERPLDELASGLVNPSSGLNRRASDFRARCTSRWQISETRRLSGRRRQERRVRRRKSAKLPRCVVSRRTSARAADRDGVQLTPPDRHWRPTRSLDMEALRVHMRAMVLGYLREARKLEPCSRSGLGLSD